MFGRKPTSPIYSAWKSTECHQTGHEWLFAPRLVTVRVIFTQQGTGNFQTNKSILPKKFARTIEMTSKNYPVK